MSTPFDPNNPFNVRGVNISPGMPDGTEPKNNIYYYLIFIDVVKNQEAGGGVNATLFTPLNFQETGSTLTYGYNSPLQIPVDPSIDPNQVIETIALPLYTNQKIDKPDPNQNGNNLTITISTFDQNGNPLLISGNPNKQKPPVFPVINGPNDLVGVEVTSLTDGSPFCVYMANPGPSNDINCANVFSNANTSTGEKLYYLYFQYQLPGTSPFAWQNLLPGRNDEGVAVVGGVASTATSWPYIIILAPGVQVDPTLPAGEQGYAAETPIENMQYISM
ncbi:MAG: hypothetical protein K1X81_01125 [Bacteroidia bacterium]|nr:hypothetical protein [Bacteroidia bacterium]